MNRNEKQERKKEKGGEKEVEGRKKGRERSGGRVGRRERVLSHHVERMIKEETRRGSGL